MKQKIIVSVIEIKKYPRVYQLYLKSPETVSKSIRDSAEKLWSGNITAALSAVEDYLENFG